MLPPSLPLSKPVGKISLGEADHNKKRERRGTEERDSLHQVCRGFARGGSREVATRGLSYILLGERRASLRGLERTLQKGRVDDARGGDPRSDPSLGPRGRVRRGWPARHSASQLASRLAAPAPPTSVSKENPTCPSGVGAPGSASAFTGLCLGVCLTRQRTGLRPACQALGVTSPQNPGLNGETPPSWPHSQGLGISTGRVFLKILSPPWLVWPHG